MKVFFDTVGCRLNQAEIEKMAMQFRAAGHEVVESAHLADLVIINTCNVTAEAASDSRQKARQAYKAGADEILLTGCWATLSADEAFRLPGVKGVIDNGGKENLAETVLKRSISMIDLDPLERQPLPGIHKRTRAFIKVQDGCDNHCTFCVTCIARGRSKSTDEKEILAQISNAEKSGCHEVVLTGVNLGAWGRENDRGKTLRDLIEFILKNSSIDRLRLSSIEPWDMDDGFLALWGDPRMCRHFHIPLQSGSTATLKRMARRTTPDIFRKLVQNVRYHLPGVAITTDVIVGFPGENNEEFHESLEFVNEMSFAGGHVFRFSPREGTPAVLLPDRVRGEIARQRSELMREALKRSEATFWQSFLGSEADVLWESSEGTEGGRCRLHGLTDNYLPVCIESSENAWNRIEKVKLRAIQGNSIEGDFIHN